MNRINNIDYGRVSIGIIGFGRFGQLMAAVLAKHFDVYVSRHRHDAEEERLIGHVGAKPASFDFIVQRDIVVLAVPMSQTEEVVKRVAPKMKVGALLVDTCSVKVDPCQWLQKYAPKDIQILGTHPMFGAVTSKFDIEEVKWNLAGLQIVLCPLRIGKDLLAGIKKFLTKLGLEVIETTPVDHDKQNAKTLSFVHFIGRAFMRSGIKEQKIFTPGYSDLLKILPHTTSDNWQLFYDMNNLNHYADQVREHFFDSAFEIEEKIMRSRTDDDFAYHRSMIDLSDKRILEMLKKRFAHAEEIGKIKKKKGLTIVDKKREREIVAKRAEESGLDEEFLKRFYKVVFEEARKRQA